MEILIYVETAKKLIDKKKFSAKMQICSDSTAKDLIFVF